MRVKRIGATKVSPLKAIFRTRPPHLTWMEATMQPPFARAEVIDVSAADRLARTFADARNTEIRWNLEGASQGHYIQPSGIIPTAQ